MIKRSLYLLTLTIIFCLTSVDKVFSQDFPEKQSPPRLVNDFAGMLRPDQVMRLEQKLVAFNDSASTQIAIVIVSSLHGYDKADYAQQLGEKWGIGQKGKNNGILVLVKAKSADAKGEVQIATGYGAEGSVPDLVCGEIVDRDILPSFRSKDYYGGLDKATTTLMSLIRGEYTAEEYGKRAPKGDHGGFPIGAIIVIFIIIAAISRGSGGSNNRHISTGGLPFWMLMGMMNSGKGSDGSWGGFSGGGSSGGGGGGFGGFGGGSFGGGGAGGSW
jgi:uncharacterized protein